MNAYNRLTLLVFLTPIFAALIYAVYYYESRHSLMEHLIKSGVIALYDGGMVRREDIRDYFLMPPIDDQSTILNALEMTPADLADFGMDEKDFELLQQEEGQFLISQVIKHIALVKYLNSQGIDDIPETFEEDVKAYREELMLEYMEADLARFLPDISQKDMLAYYVDHPKDFLRKGKRFAQHLMLYDNVISPDSDNPFQTTPDSIRTRLQNGEDFQSLLIQVRTEGTGNGGKLGWLERESIHQDIDRALWALDIGEITGPIPIDKTLEVDEEAESSPVEKTWHFIQLLDEQPGGLTPFNECEDDIRSVLEERERLTYRFKLLGISEETLSADRNDKDGPYRPALLKAAYAREWDKNIDVVQKTNAFAQFRRADILCRVRIDRFKQTQLVYLEDESTWSLVNETINKILEEMNFRILVKLKMPKSYNVSEEEANRQSREE